MWNFRPPLCINAGCEPVWKSLLLLSWGSELLSEHKVIRFQMPLANWKPPSAPLLHEENPGLYATLREAGWVSKTPFPLKSKGEGFAPLCSREAVTPCASRRRLLPSSLPPPPTPCPCRPSCREAYLGRAPACARACARACVSRWVGAWSPHYTAAMLHFWLLIVQSPSPWRREQLLHSGPWLGCAGWPARPPAQPWELPALRPPAAHGPCQAGRKKACLLTPSAQLPGYRGSAQETSGPGHREVGLEPGRLQPREHCPWPAAPWPASSQVRGSSLEAQPQAPGAFRGPGEALSEVFRAPPRTPSQPSRPRRPLYSVPVRRFP